MRPDTCLNFRTNNSLLQSFAVNGVNELSTAWRSGTFTVQGMVGTVNPAVSEVNVSGTGLSTGAADLYADQTWARAGASLADGINNFTATADDGISQTNTATVSCWLPQTNNYTYDANGNLTSDGRRYFEYDDENQLTAVTVSNAWRSEFAYDGKMRRRLRYEKAWNGSIWITNSIVEYVYDGNLAIQERDGANAPQVTYTRGRDMSGTLEGAGGIGGLLARTVNTNLVLHPSAAHAYYHADGNGNITALFSGAGVAVARYVYDPYGNVVGQSGPLAEANLYRFSSKEWHDNSWGTGSDRRNAQGTGQN